MKIFKKTLAMLLSIVMVFGVMPASIFTVSAADSLIEGTTGTGTEADPVIVSNAEELVAALNYPSPLVIQIDSTMSSMDPIDITTDDKTLIVNSTYSLYGTITVYGDNFTLKGNGEIIYYEYSYCIVNKSNNMVIDGNIKIQSFYSLLEPVLADAGTLTIKGGTFLAFSRTEDKNYSLYVDEGATAVLEDGYFKNGIISYGTVINKGVCIYEDGTVRGTLYQEVPVDILSINDIVNFTNQSPAVSEEESLNGSKDLGTYAPYLFNGKFSFTPYINEDCEELGCYLLNYNYLKKDGETVYNMTGTQADVSSLIIDSGDYEFWQEIHLYDSENNYINSRRFVYYFTIYDIDNTYDFTSHSPALSTEDKIDGLTDLGVIFEAPSFSFTAKDIHDYFKSVGYKLVAKTRIWHTDTAVQESEDPYSWTCGVYDYGTKQVRQSLMLYAPDGTLVSAKHHTYTFTYLPLTFDSRKPSVSTSEATAGVSDLGTLTTAQTFSFSAVPLDFTLKEEGYSIALKTEAYQGDTLVYSANNSDNYTHIYQGEGRVVQTIYMLNADGEVVGSKSHTYNFTMEFPEGTISLSSDFLTLTENTTHQLSATFSPESLAETFVWTSSNSEVATIDSNGIITAIRPGSALITATLGNSATAYCTVLVTAEDVKAYVGGIGLKEGEYLAQGSNIPTMMKPSDNYAYLSTVNGTLTLTLHNYSYSGMGTFISKNTAYAIYSTENLKIVSESINTIGPMSAPVDRYTSYGIGKGDTVSITSDGISMLTITGVSTGISSSGYVFTSGNVNIINVTNGISCTHAQSMGGANFQNGLLNINCTGTAITVTGNYINFSGSNVIINCKNGINIVRQGEITVDGSSLKLYASANGINVKSGQTMTVNSGTALIEAVNNAVALEGALTINGGSIILKSTDTESDSSYSAINGAGTLTLASTIKSVASTSSNYSTSSLYADSRRSTFDYVSFRDSNDYIFVKQPQGAAIKGNMQAYVTWETNFKPTKLELITFDGTSSTTTTIDSYSNYIELDALPEGGHYQLRAYYATNYYIDSSYIYVSTIPNTVYFCFGDTPIASQDVTYGECAKEPEPPAMENYFFYGWIGPDGKVFDFSTPITEDIMLRAGWADIKVNGVVMPNGTYLGQYSGAVTTAKPSDHWAYYKDGVLTLYNFDSSNGAGIEFGEIDLTVVSSGNGNAVSCIVSDYDYANLTIDGTAQLNVGHSQWIYSAIQVYNTITFKCDTVVECVDAMAIPDAEAIIVDGADVIIKGYADTAWANGIYGCEAPITVLDGSLYIYCEGGDSITDSYIANPDKVIVYANNNLDGVFTDDDIITQVDEAYDLNNYAQIKIVHKHTTVLCKGMEPTCMTTGIADYYKCVCGKLFSDAEGTKEITDLDKWMKGEGALPVGGHSFINYDALCIFGCGTRAIEAKNGAIIDDAKELIYGLETGLDTDSIMNYIEIDDNVEISFSSDTIGTGTVITLKDKATSFILAEYTVVIFGDYNGDGFADAEDTTYFASISNFEVFDYYEHEYLFMAADVNGDGVVDAMDEEDMNAVANFEAYIDQTVTEGSRVFNY